jgi:hypothetical protein
MKNSSVRQSNFTMSEVRKEVVKQCGLGNQFKFYLNQYPLTA